MDGVDKEADLRIDFVADETWHAVYETVAEEDEMAADVVADDVVTDIDL